MPQVSAEFLASPLHDTTFLRRFRPLALSSSHLIRSAFRRRATGTVRQSLASRNTGCVQVCVIGGGAGVFAHALGLAAAGGLQKRPRARAHGMLPGLRILFAITLLSVSVLIFGLGAA